MFSLFDITAKRASLDGDKVAMQEPGSGRSVTYSALDQNTAKTASFLAAQGIKPGDRVAVLCQNSIAFFETLFACGKLGAVLVPLNWRMPANELRTLTADCTPGLLLFDEAFRETATALGVAKSAPLVSDAADDLATLRESFEPHKGRLSWPADDAWYLLYTSGTTGVPKAVVQTYGMALVNYINLGQAINLTSEDRTLNFLPLFHTAGINLYTLPTLIAGGTVTVLPAFDEEVVIDLLAAGDLDTFFGVPAVYQLLSLHPRFGEVDLTKVRNWGCGGAPLSDALVTLYQDRGIVVCNGYGMTETGPTVFLMDPAHVKEKIGSVGKAQIMTAVRIVDESGADVPEGGVGEMWLKGPGLTPGYWNKPEATATAFTEDGWLRTGDLAQADEDGFFYIVGRAKEMFISGGENVYPAEVENILCDHPAVLEVAVVGKQDEKWGEVGVAFTMLREGAGQMSQDTLRAYCRENMAAYKIPKEFVFVGDFPRTAAGKIQKHLLKP